MNLIGCRDADEQTHDYKWRSLRQTFCLRNALIQIVLGGNTDAYAEITSANLTLPMDCLSLTAVSYHTSNVPGMFSLLFFRHRLHLDAQGVSDHHWGQGPQ